MFTDHTTDWQGKMLGRYRLIRPLGRGGMGEVWLAEDQQLKRQVAVKLLPPVIAEDRQYLQAFTNEARTAASLEHPHILPVHDFGEQQIGEDEIITFLVMPSITGGSLRERISSANRPLPIGEALQYLRQAGEGIDYAHSKRVLHRDIKPANMLLQNAWLLLADFGIAKILSTTRHSQTQAGAGTPEFMAPEQAQGQATDASDRYSLTMVAYQLFTGSLPFRGSTPYETMMKQLTEQPVSPRQYNPQIPPAVEGAILRGLSKRPAERQPTCKAFVDELEQGWQIERHESTDPDATLLAPWSKRALEDEFKKAGIPYGAQMTPQQGSTPSSGSLQPHNITPQAGPISGPPSQLPPTIQAPLSSPNTFPSTLPYSGVQMGSGMPVPPLTPQPYNQGPPSTPPTPYSGPQAETPREQPPQQVSRRGLIIGGAVGAAVLVAGGGTTIALLHPGNPAPQAKKQPTPTPTPRRGPVNLVKGTPLLTLAAHSDVVWNAVWSPNGNSLVTVGQDQKVILWDIQSYLKTSNTQQTITTPVQKWRLDNTIESSDIASWTPDSHYFAVVDPEETNKIRLYDAVKQTQVTTGYTNSSFDSSSVNLMNSFESVAYAHNSAMLAASRNITSKIEIDIWKDTDKSKPWKTLRTTATDPRANLNTVSWSMDDKYIAGYGNDSVIYIWNVQTGENKAKWEMPASPHQATIVERYALKWSPTDPNVLLASDNDIVVVYNLKENKAVFLLGTDDKDALTIPKDTGGIKWEPHLNGIVWSSNGRYIAGTYGRSNKIYIWDTQNLLPLQGKNTYHIQNMLFGQEGHSTAIVEITWSPDGRYLATGAFDKTCIIWKVDDSA